MDISGSLDTRELFITHIRECENDAESLQLLFLDTEGNEADKKSVLDQAFRDVLRELLREQSGPVDTAECTKLVLLSINSAQLGICYHTVPFILLSDLLDSVTLDVCNQVFDFVENQVSTWTQPDFYSNGKILLLRMCNDLLRRLSSAQNTVFCGRIQLFLARLFPLSEKSALNLMSHFNLENVTSYNREAGKSGAEGAEKGEEPMEVDKKGRDDREEGGPDPVTAGPVDYNLYHKLWSLQDFFRQPTQCYVPDQWKVFIANVQEVLQAFDSYKLEDVTTTSSSSPASISSSSSSSTSRRKRKKGEKDRREAQHMAQCSASVVEYSESHYFAKFLTSEKLMNLQLRDSHFRRHVLVQLLILFQYLGGDVKFKTQAHVTSDAQTQWIKDTTDRVYQLLSETPPNGREFVAYIKWALKSEENWVAWKNDGCPSFEKDPLQRDDPNRLSYARKPHLGDKIGHPSQKIDMGSTELTRLWNICPDNLEACKAKNRVFVPEMEKFLEEPYEQADPEARIDPEYKMVNNPNFSWQCLRLLSQKSMHFFQGTTAQTKPLPEYLDSVVLQTGKDLASKVSA